MVIISGFFEPVFYLAGIGFGLGGLVGGLAGPGGGEISYALFVAPALLASSAMNGAITEGTYNFFFKLTHDRTFESILSTPLGPRDVAVGELGWALVRGGIYASGFTVIMVEIRSARKTASQVFSRSCHGFTLCRKTCSMRTASAGARSGSWSPIWRNVAPDGRLSNERASA